MQRRDKIRVWIWVGVAVLAWLGIVILGIVFIVRAPGEVVVGLLGAIALVAGGWWALVERRAKRILGAMLAAAGFATLCVVIVWLITGPVKIAIAVGLLVVLSAISGLAGRGALRAAKRYVGKKTGATRRAPATRPVLICNPKSGGGKVGKFGLVELARERGIETKLLEPGDDLSELARSALEEGADAIGMAGGDGSQALVASIAIEADVPYVCIPAGTRNHLARDLGLDRDDPRPALDAFFDGTERRIDFGTVGDRLFVNNVSLGLYAKIVQQESYRDAKLETTMRMLPDMIGSEAEPFDLDFEGPDAEPVDNAWMILVSNNPYVIDNWLELGERPSIDDARLGIAALATGGVHDIVGTVMLGPQRSPAWHEWTAETFTIESGDALVPAGVDGEALQLEPPLVFRIHPAGLRVLVPNGNPKIADERRYRRLRRENVGTLLRKTSGQQTGD